MEESDGVHELVQGRSEFCGAGAALEVHLLSASDATHAGPAAGSAAHDGDVVSIGGKPRAEAKKKSRLSTFYIKISIKTLRYAGILLVNAYRSVNNV